MLIYALYHTTYNVLMSSPMQEEWYILFHYLLQYPLLIQEIYDSISGSRVKSVRIHTKLKKVCWVFSAGVKTLHLIVFCFVQICQFLSQLSHSVSSYYRRVRILLVKTHIKISLPPLSPLYLTFISLPTVTRASFDTTGACQTITSDSYQTDNVQCIETTLNRTSTATLKKLFSFFEWTVCVKL